MASDDTGGMSKLSRQVVIDVNAELNQTELAILARSSLDLAKLKPQISDAESFNKLIEAVSAANAHDESIGEFHNRLQALGSGVLTVAKKVAALI